MNCEEDFLRDRVTELTARRDDAQRQESDWTTRLQVSLVHTEVMQLTD